MTKTILIVCSLIVIGLLGFSATRMTTRSQTTDSKKQKAEEVTLLQEGVVTEKQKTNGKFFQRHKTGRKVRDLVSAGTGEVVLRSKIVPPMIVGGSKCPSYPSAGLVDLVHEADVAVVVVLGDKSYSQVTDSGDFLFSSYRAIVEEVLKDNNANPIQPGSAISILRPGGLAQLNGRKVRALAGSFEQFEPSSRYVLFLKYVQPTGDYLAFSNGSFLLQQNESVIELIDGTTLRQRTAAFITETRDAVNATPCGKRPLY